MFLQQNGEKQITFNLEVGNSLVPGISSQADTMRVIPLSMTRNGVCMPATWFSPTSVSRSHQPGLEAFISRVLNEPKIENEGQNYRLKG